MEQIILTADVIARASLVSKRTQVAQLYTEENSGWGVAIWSPMLEFRFRVHEYLKGSGPAEIGGVVYRTDHAGSHWTTREQAQAGAENMLAAHDSRWDSREAIVFLWSEDHYIDDRIQLATGQYWFGPMVYPGFISAYSVASIFKKAWLPEATQSGGGTARSTDEKLFLLDAPVPTSTQAMAARFSAPYRVGRASPSASSSPTISLSALKQRVKALEAAANAGGTPEYRACIEASYSYENALRNAIVRDGPMPHVEHTIAIESGLPADTHLQDYPTGSGPSRDEIGIGWFKGPDKDLVRFVNVDFTTSTANQIRFTRRAVTTRPLPASDYTVYPNYTWHGGMVCARYPEISRNHFALYLTVTAPERTLHEAFFDPVAIGTAVGADGANGVLNPSAFSLDGTTTTITSLKWENGGVTMALSPTSTSLADYAIDFIDTTGTTTLSLTSDNASTTVLTWTVPSKPWADGDLLMLRIHEPAPAAPVTVTITPRPEGRFTFFDLTVSWNDPQACDGRYFVYVGTDTWVIRNLGFHAASVSTVTSATGWRYDSVPDYWVFVRCDSSGGGQSRDVGRASLRAALE